MKMVSLKQPCNQIMKPPQIYYFRLQIPVSTIHIPLVSPSLRRTSAPIQFTIVLGVLETQETLCYLVAGLLESDHLHPRLPRIDKP